MTTCKRCGLFHSAGKPCVGQDLLPIAAGDTTLPMNALLAGRYLVLKVVHHGGMSVVYVARDTVMGNRLVALKELRLPAGATREERQEAEAWFAREAYILSSVSHPLIPAFYSAFDEDGTSYIVQEYVSGQNLHEVVTSRGPVPEAAVVDWAIALCGLLEYLHGLEDPLLFRDLKPSNIVLCDKGAGAQGSISTLKVVDFGIARHYQPDTVGTVIGTPGYAPPEQYQGLATPRSDVYALGATMHRLLTGYDPEHGTPFTFGNARSLNPLLSPAIARVVSRATRLDASERYESASTMRDDLLSIAWESGRWKASRGMGIGDTHARHQAGVPWTFRWTSLLVCAMLVVPGIMSLVTGVHSHFNDPQNAFESVTSAPLNTLACDPMATTIGIDASVGGPTSAPTPGTADCQNQATVEVVVLPDAGRNAIFAPSDVAVSSGTTVLFKSMAPDCTIVPWQSSVPAGEYPMLEVSFTMAGTYAYHCREHPSTAGVIRVH